MNYWKHKESTYKAVALAGSLAAPCGATFLLVEHQGGIYKLVDHQLQYVETKQHFKESIQQGYAVKLPKSFQVPKRTQAWFINLAWKKTYEPVIRGLAKLLENLLAARGRSPVILFNNDTLQLVLADAKTIGRIRGQLGEALKEAIDKKMERHFAQAIREYLASGPGPAPNLSAPVTKRKTQFEEIEQWAWIGAFCSGPVTLPRLYWYFMLALGFVYSQRVDVIAEERLFEFNVHKFWGGLSLEAFREKIVLWKKLYLEKANASVEKELSAKHLQRTKIPA